MKRIVSALLLAGMVGACAPPPGPAFNQHDFARGGPDAPEMNERTMTFMQPGNPYANVDGLRPRSEQELHENAERWNTSRKITRWQEYKGTMVRVEILLGDTDLRHMRLKVMQNADGGHIDGDLRDILGRVSDFQMRRVCGRRAETIAIIFDRPAFETVRPNPYFDHRIQVEGNSMREYGFRCVYFR